MPERSHHSTIPSTYRPDVQYREAGRLTHHASMLIVLEHAVPPLMMIGLAAWLWALSSERNVVGSSGSSGLSSL